MYLIPNNKGYALNFTDFKNFMIAASEIWVASLKKWIENSLSQSDQLIIEHEEFMRSPKPYLRQILNFLNLPIDENRIECTVQNTPLIALYRPISDRVKQYVYENDEANNILIKGINEINQLLLKKGINHTLDYDFSKFKKFRFHISE